jgi:hypothetical protein
VHLGLTFNVNLADIADWSYLRTATLLKSFAPVIQAGSLPVYKPGYFGTYDTKANRGAMSVAERFQEDKLLIFELMPEFCMLNLSRPLPVQDEITKGFVQFTLDKKPTLWLCFAAQMMLDAHHATRSSQLNGFADLRMSGLRIARTIEDYWKVAATHGIPARAAGAEGLAGRDGFLNILRAAFLFQAALALLLDGFMVLRRAVARDVYTASRDAT